MEFALIAPVLLLLVFGVFDFGRGMSQNVTVSNSAREGARYMAAASSTSTSSQNWGFGDCPGALSGGVPASPTYGGTFKAWHQLQADNLTLANVKFYAYFYDSNNDPALDSPHTNPDMKMSCTPGSSIATVAPKGSYTPKSTDWVVFEIKYSYAPNTPVISALFPTISLDQLTTMVMD